MKKNVLTIIGLILLIGGCVCACFTEIAGDVPALAVASFGLGLLVVSTVQKAEKKDWKLYVSIILVCIGGFLCALAGLAESTMTQIITLVISLVTLVIGLVLPKLLAKN